MSTLRWILWMPIVLLAGCAHHSQSSLIQAVETGDVQTLRTLLAQGADPNQTNGRGLTALIICARNGSVPAAEALLQHGADPNRRGGVNDWTPLMHAIHKNQLGTVRALLDGGAQVDTRSRGGETALMMAAGYGYTPLVELLLDRGANPRAVASDGSNVLAIALTGVPDMDRFTLASCQAGTVLVLKRRYPDLHLPDNLWARVAQVAGGVAKWRGCTY
jgi:ankyrin repeat protein